MSKAVFEKIKKILEENKISYDLLEHEPVRTSQQAAEVRERLRGTPVPELLKRGAKAMIVRSEGNFYQLIISASKKIDFAKVKRILNTSSASLASPEEAQKVTDCVPGSVPPFGNLFNIPVYVDKSLLENKEIDFNAGELTISIFMKLEDWLKIVKPKIVDFCANN